MHLSPHLLSLLAREFSRWGTLGLFLMAAIDSSSLPLLPEVLLIALVLRHPERLFWYAGVTTAGALAGSLILFALARHWGGAWIERQMPPRRYRRIQRWFDRYELVAVGLPMLLPPPMPVKLFVIGAGLFDMSYVRFSLSTAIGRGLRYLLEAWLAVRYGASALAYLRRHPFIILLIAAALLLAGIAYGRRRRAAAGPAPAASPDSDIGLADAVPALAPPPLPAAAAEPLPLDQA